MSFNSTFRLAADLRLPLPVRYCMFIQTCSEFGGLARSGMQPVHDTLGRRFAFSREDKPDGVQLTLALNTIIQLRFRLLHLLAEDRIKRRRHKARGERQKAPPPFSSEQVLSWLLGQDAEPPSRPNPA